MQSLTPILIVDEIEPSLKFWSKLGYEKIVEVPEGDRLGFIILRSGPVEIMYQSRASVAKDVPAMADFPSSSVLYLRVSNLDEIMKALTGVEVVVPKRITFYGATEWSVREPGGNVIGFAERADAD